MKEDYYKKAEELGAQIRLAKRNFSDISEKISQIESIALKIKDTLDLIKKRKGE